MADYVISTTLTADDQVSVAANAAAASLDRAADAADRVEVATTAAGRSATSYRNQLIPTEAATQAVARAVREAAAASAALKADMDAGRTTADEYAAAMATADAKVDAARARLAAARAAVTDYTGATRTATTTVSQATTATTEHANALGLTARQARELAPQLNDLVTTISTGGGVLQAFLQQGGQITPVFGGVRGTLAALATALGGPVGIGLTVAAAGMAYMAVQAESAARRLDDLSARLRVTRSDYETLAAAGEKAARAVASTSTVGVGDARTAYATLAAVPDYSGSTRQLQDLIRLSADVAKGFGEDVPAAASRLADGLRNPAAAAKKLADEGFAGLNQAQARAIELMQASGNTTGAQTALIEAYRRQLGGLATDGVTPLQKALTDLSNAFTSAGDNGKSLGQELGGAVLQGVTTLVIQVRELVEAAQKVRDWLGRGGSSPVVDQNTGQVPRVSAELQTKNPETLNSIYRIAEANGIAPVVADLATRVAYQESRGYQTNGTGGLLTSSAGAVGVMQLMPGTAAGRDINPNGNLDPSKIDDNILLGLRYLAKLSQDPRFKSEADVAGAYNMGPGGYASYQAGQRGLPDETRKYIRNVAGVDAPAAGMTLDPITVTAPQGLPASVSEALKLPNSTTMRSLEDADARISLLVRAIGDLSNAGETSGKTWDTLQAQLAKARGQYAEIGTAVDLSNRRVTDGLIPLQSMTGAARVLATAQNELTLAARANGEEVTQEQRTARNTAEQVKLTAAFNDGLDALNRSTAAQEKINADYGASAHSIIEAQNAAKAEAETRETAGNPAEYARQLDLKTAALNRASAAQAEGNTIAKGFDQRDQIEALRLETSLIGANADVRARELALLKERQALTRAGGPGAVDTASGRADLANVVEIQNATAALNQQKQAMDELASFGTQAFDRIGTAITQAFATGSLKALDFGSLARGVVSEVAQEFLKLALLNPLKNALFGGTSATLGSVGGLVGSLLGGTTSQVVSSAATVDVSAFEGAGTTVDAAGNIASAGASGANTAGGGGIGVLGGLKVAYDLGKMVMGGAANFGVGTLAGAAASGITSLLGNASAATNLALNAAGQGVYGVATAGQVAVAGVAQAAGATAATTATVTSAVSTIANVLPYVGAAVTLATQLAQGNYRGAALVAGGAAIGTAILPGVGTAIGAAAGALLESFLPNHPKNPFEAIDVMATDGKLSRGRTLSQIIDSTKDAGTVDTFATGLNEYMGQTGIKLANANGRVAIVGTGADPKVNNYTDMVGLMKSLRFTSAQDDGSNFSIAKAGALPGQEFTSLEGLSKALLKIATFSDGVDRLGLQIKSVGNDLVNIQIAGLKAGRAPSSDLETAFANALPGQTFADAAAFEAEITKINDFVNGTIPSLLNPVFETVTPLQKQIQDTVRQYADAIATAQKYGLATEGLTAAQAKAIAVLQVPAIEALKSTNLEIVRRGQAAAGTNTDATDLQLFDINATKQRADLVDSYKNIWGSLIPVQEQYGVASKALDVTLANERLALQRQQNAALVQASRAETDAGASVYAAFINIRSRGNVAAGDTKDSDLNTYNLKAIAETTAYQRQLVDFYGDSFLASTDYQNRMTELENVQNAERLAIVQKYADQEKNAVITAHNAIANVVTGLDTYAKGLQTSALSPLSAQSQLTLARNQFNAVSGAAAAGDFNSTQKLQGYADTFLNASRAVNGSGVAYVADFNKVLDALQQVATAPVDTLTASYQASLVQNQTDQLVTELRALKAEVAALRKETAQGSAAPARVAA